MTYDVEEQWLSAIQEQRAQQCLGLIESLSGVYAYGKHIPADVELYDAEMLDLLDGSGMLDGSGGLSNIFRIIDRGARVLNFSDIDYTLTPNSGSLISGLSMSELSEYTLTLNASDGHFSKIFAMESWLASRLTIKFGFRGLSYAYFVPVFSGIITDVELKGTVCLVTALNK